jgi:hypothetical protein
MKKYRIIYADPPWKYDNVRTGGSLQSGAAAKYPVLTIDEIKSFQVSNLAHKGENEICGGKDKL